MRVRERGGGRKGGKEIERWERWLCTQVCVVKVDSLNSGAYSNWWRSLWCRPLSSPASSHLLGGACLWGEEVLLVLQGRGREVVPTLWRNASQQTRGMPLSSLCQSLVCILVRSCTVVAINFTFYYPLLWRPLLRKFILLNIFCLYFHYRKSTLVLYHRECGTGVWRWEVVRWS